MKALMTEFWQEEDGIQTVEMVVILVVLVSLIGVFANQAGDWMDAITTRINALVSSYT